MPITNENWDYLQITANLWKDTIVSVFLAPQLTTLLLCLPPSSGSLGPDLEGLGPKMIRQCPMPGETPFLLDAFIPSAAAQEPNFSCCRLGFALSQTRDLENWEMSPKEVMPGFWYVFSKPSFYDNVLLMNEAPSTPRLPCDVCVYLYMIVSMYVHMYVKVRGQCLKN